MDLLYTAHVPPGPGPFPTILALHGWGASAHDLLGLAPVLHGGGALVLCPQGPLAFEIGEGYVGHGWFELSQVRPPTAADITRAADQVRAFLDAAAQRYPIDRRKLVAMGFSQGGVLAYELALSDPGRFAGVVALSSWLPADLADAIPAQPGSENFPALVVHGTFRGLGLVVRRLARCHPWGGEGFDPVPGPHARHEAPARPVRKEA